jgi:hypothetical protein
MTLKKQMEKRMKLILKGKTYPVKHIIRPLPVSLPSTPSTPSISIPKGVENEMTDEEEDQQKIQQKKRQDDEWEIRHQELKALEKALDEEYPREEIMTPYGEKIRGMDFLFDDGDEKTETKNLRSICKVRIHPEGVYLDFKYKEDNIRPRSTFFPVETAEDAMTVCYKVVHELMKPDIRFSVRSDLSLLPTLVEEINKLYYRTKNVNAKHRQDIPELTNSTYPPKKIQE